MIFAIERFQLTSKSKPLEGKFVIIVEHNYDGRTKVTNCGNGLTMQSDKKCSACNCCIFTAKNCKSVTSDEDSRSTILEAIIFILTIILQ